MDKLLIHMPVLGFFCLAARIVALGATVGDALAMAALASLYGYQLYLSSKKEVPVNDTLRAELMDLRNQMSAMNSASQLAKVQTRR